MATSSNVDSSFSFKFRTGLRGYHVYRHTENWIPFIGQNVHFRRELNNTKDRFAVAGQVMIQGRIGRVTVGHVPRELSRYVWHALLHGAQFTAHVKDPRHKRSPLTQGGLEIELEVKLWWADELKCEILKEKIMECGYPDEYADESKSILEEILDPKDLESDSSEVEEGEEEGRDNVPANISDSDDVLGDESEEGDSDSDSDSDDDLDSEEDSDHESDPEEDSDQGHESDPDNSDEDVIIIE